LPAGNYGLTIGLAKFIDSACGAQFLSRHTFFCAELVNFEQCACLVSKKFAALLCITTAATPVGALAMLITEYCVHLRRRRLFPYFYRGGKFSPREEHICVDTFGLRPRRSIGK